MSGILALGVVGLIAAIVMWQANKGNQGDPKVRAGAKMGIIVAIIVIVIGFVGGAFTTVPAGHRGVVIRFQAATGTVLEEGLQFKVPFIDTVENMSIQTQKYEVPSSAVTNDLQDVSTTIALNWHLNPLMAATVYTELGLGYIERIAAPAVQEVIKQVTSKYTAEDLILRRLQVKNDIFDELKVRLAERGIVAETLSITNFTFSATFTAAIEAKVSAEQAVLEAQNKLEQVKVEAQQAEEEARGFAAARIAQANGEAEYISVVTAAQVAANDAISSSLTPEILQYILLDRLGDDIKVMVIPSGQSLDLILPDLSQ